MKTPRKLRLFVLTFGLGCATALLAAELHHLTAMDLSCAGPRTTPVSDEEAMSKVLKSLPVTGGSQSFGSLDAMHEHYIGQFQTAPGFGSSRMFRLPRLNEIELPGYTYTIKLPDLISLENEPVVYRSSEINIVGMNVLTNRATKPHLPKRETTLAEANAVMKLRRGENMVIVKSLVLPVGMPEFPTTRPSPHPTSPQPATPVVSGAASRIPPVRPASRVPLTVPQPMQMDNRIPGLLAVGALRAGKACADCHGCEEGTLLGAFSYQLIPRPSTNTPIPFIARNKVGAPIVRGQPGIAAVQKPQSSRQ